MGKVDSKNAGRRPKLIRPILILGVVGLVGYYYYRINANRPPDGVIVASGSIEATETTISPKVAGRLLTLKVDEGDDVRKGQVVARIDDTELSAQLGQAQAALQAAQAKLDLALHGNRPEQIRQAEAQLSAARSTALGSRRVLGSSQRNILTVLDLRTQLDAAESRLPVEEAAYRQSVQSLKLIESGTRPLQIDEARASLAQAKIGLSKSESDLKRIRILANEGAAPGQSLDDAQAQRDASAKQVEQAQAHFDDLVAGPRPEEIREAEMTVAQAKANLDGARTNLANMRRTYRDRLSAQSQFDSQAASVEVANAQVASAQAELDLMRNGSRPEDIQNAKASRDQAGKAVEYAKELVADTVLYAPTDGVIKTKDSQTGETLSPGTPVLTVADLDHIWIRVYVPEDKYGVLKLGQPVDIKVDSFPDRVFKGRIITISSDFEFTPKNAQTPEERVKLVFGVKIEIENSDRRLKPGMPGDAWIRVK
ncbi:MAG: efflux RND transporter periplasmic adaptor subunit [Fimbriimonas sp.]|nr:efflux RND transporter periplasmic adaptor subunit [Fimbriimonas sp.]